jgi:phosphoribosylaminoimidazole (AIR) synthetase
MNEAERQGLAYAQAGVDIDAGNRLVELIKPLVMKVLADAGKTAIELAEVVPAHGNEPVVYAGRLDLAW